MVTDIGIELGKLAHRNRRRDASRRWQADLDKLGMLAGLVALFFVGGMLGAAGYLGVGFPILIAPALLLLLGGVASADGRPARSLTRARGNEPDDSRRGARPAYP